MVVYMRIYKPNNLNLQWKVTIDVMTFFPELEPVTDPDDDDVLPELVSSNENDDDDNDTQ
jgi:hypothetical protein